MLIRLNVVFLLVIFSSSAVSAPRQAHLPLTSGLPPLPELPLNAGVRYAGSPQLEYPSQVKLGGNPIFSLSGALRDVPYAARQPFHEWDVNHASGPSAFDCPDGFSLTPENTCVLVEFRRPEESCPYGTFRGKAHHGCVQIDSVPPDRTCASGFQYFMRGCIRRTQAPPILTCSAGYSQLEDACYSVSSVAPQIHCPAGFGLREEIPEDLSDAASPPSMHVCYKEHLSPPTFICPDGSTAQGMFPEPDMPAVPIPECRQPVEMPPISVCPEGFQLVSKKEVEFGVENSPLITIDEDGVNALQCVKVAEYPGQVVCPAGYKLVWSVGTDMATKDFSLDRVKCVLQGAARKGWTPSAAVKTLFRSFPYVEKSKTLQNETAVVAAPNTTNQRDKWLQKQSHWGEMETVELAHTLDHSPKSEKITVFTNSDGQRTLQRDNIDLSDIISGEIRAMRQQSKGTGSSPKKGKKRGYYSEEVAAPSSNSGRKLTDTETMPDEVIAPTIIFERGSCNHEASIVWKRAVDPTSVVNFPFLSVQQQKEVVLQPFCREVQVVKSSLECPNTARIECRNYQEFIVEDNLPQSYAVPLTDGTDAVQPFNHSQSGNINRSSEVRLLKALFPARLTPSNCVERLQGTAVCVESELKVPAQPSCPPKSVLHSRGVAPDEDFERFLCIEEEVVPALLECPFGVGSIGEMTGRCDVLVTLPIDAACPEGYTRGQQDLGAFGNHLFSRMNRKPLSLLPEPSGGTAGICELIEYADYQITCPTGYQREGAKNNAMACLAEKPIPSSIVCPPGFVLNGALEVAVLGDPQACQKTVEVAPTIISYPQQEIPPSPSGHIDGPIATACVLTKEHKLSCGMERKYHGAVDMAKQVKMGETYKLKADAKNRKYTEKYTHS